MPKKPSTMEEQIERHMGEPNERGCREWKGIRQKSGYGRIKSGGRSLMAARMVWAATHGPIPAGLEICHRCDNPPCCNIEHLFIGTRGDNARDRQAKGRGAPQHGSHNPFAILTEPQVAAILADRRRAGEIANEYGLNIGTVRGIRARRSWRHVPDPRPSP